MNFIKPAAHKAIIKNSEASCAMKRIAKSLALITVIRDRSENRRSEYSAEYIAIYGTPEKQILEKEIEIAKAFLYIDAITSHGVKTRRFIDVENRSDVEDLVDEITAFISEKFVDDNGQMRSVI